MDSTHPTGLTSVDQLDAEFGALVERLATSLAKERLQTSSPHKVLFGNDKEVLAERSPSPIYEEEANKGSPNDSKPNNNTSSASPKRRLNPNELRNVISKVYGHSHVPKVPGKTLDDWRTFVENTKRGTQTNSTGTSHPSSLRKSSTSRTQRRSPSPTLRLVHEQLKALQLQTKRMWQSDGSPKVPTTPKEAWTPDKEWSTRPSKNTVVERNSYEKRKYVHQTYSKSPRGINKLRNP
eukprot:PhF_6_TR40536/c0_g1_i2/m.60732